MLRGIAYATRGNFDYFFVAALWYLKLKIPQFFLRDFYQELHLFELLFMGRKPIDLTVFDGIVVFVLGRIYFAILIGIYFFVPNVDKIGAVFDGVIF